MLKNNWNFLLLNLILSVLCFLIFAPDYILLHYLNTLFYICLFYLILYLLMYTIKGGFFDGVTFGFRRFHSLFSRDKDSLDDWKEKPLPSEKYSHTLYQMIKFQSLFLLLLLLLLLIVFYSL